MNIQLGELTIGSVVDSDNGSYEITGILGEGNTVDIRLTKIENEPLQELLKD